MGSLFRATGRCRCKEAGVEVIADNICPKLHHVQTEQLLNGLLHPGHIGQDRLCHQAAGDILYGVLHQTGPKAHFGQDLGLRGPIIIGQIEGHFTPATPDLAISLLVKHVQRKVDILGKTAGVGHHHTGTAVDDR